MRLIQKMMEKKWILAHAARQGGKLRKRSWMACGARGFLVALLACIAIPAPTFSEAPPDKSILGSQALRARLGTPAAWEIHRKHREPARNANGGQTAPKQNEVSVTKIARVGNVIRVTEERPAIPPVVHWLVNGREVSMTSPQSSVFINSGEFAVYDFSRGDFPELGWMLGNRSVGQHEVYGQLCHVFYADAQTAAKWEQKRLEEKSNGMPVPGSPGKERAAYISVKTGLPVQVIEGNTVIEYTYPSPPAQIDLPDKAAKALADHQKLIQATFPRIPGI